MRVEAEEGVLVGASLTHLLSLHCRAALLTPAAVALTIERQEKVVVAEATVWMKHRVT